MNYFFALLLSFSLTLFSLRAYCQGCSDGGVCSVGSLSLVQFKFELLPLVENKLTRIITEDPGIDTTNSRNGIRINDSTMRTLVYETPVLSNTDTSNTKKTDFIKYTYQYPKYFFQLSTSYGIGDRRTTIITTQVEGNIRVINKKLFAQIKIPYTYITGNLGIVHGLGDITLSATYIAFSKSKSNLSLSGGIKIPTNDADLTIDNLPLPMVYQTSLGTTDGLIGAKYTLKKWDFTIGYQHSFNANKNKYLYRSGLKDSVIYNNYFESNMLRRSDDGIFRINRNFIFKKINANTGLLFIYHMKDDLYTNAAGERQQSKGSEGLTLNLNVAGIIQISKKLDFVFIYASPLITRKSRPDGLTRKFVVQVGFKYNIF